MATFRPDLAGAFPVADDQPLAGPLMSLNDWAALARAPKRPVGTEVSVRATPVEALGGREDHMFVHYDDGSKQLIARGGPTESFGPRFITRSNRVAAEVTPETSSKDYGAPYRTIATRFLPGVTADEAAGGARAHALGVDHFGNAYDWDHNSNSYADDVAQPIFGVRPGDEGTPGYRNSLRDDGAPPPPFNPLGFIRTAPIHG